jgi:hypothetical protein
MLVEETFNSLYVFLFAARVCLVVPRSKCKLLISCLMVSAPFQPANRLLFHRPFAGCVLLRNAPLLLIQFICWVLFLLWGVLLPNEPLLLNCALFNLYLPLLLMGPLLDAPLAICGVGCALCWSAPLFLNSTHRTADRIEYVDYSAFNCC